jgi:hypothetical protein
MHFTMLWLYAPFSSSQSNIAPSEIVNTLLAEEDPAWSDPPVSSMELVSNN